MSEDDLLDGPSENSLEVDVRGLAIDSSCYDTDELEVAQIGRAELLRNTLLLRAGSWVGKEFAGSEKEQCANFIRRLLVESGAWTKAANKPFDWHLTKDLPQGPSFANSFFSIENGQLRGYGDLEPGDLIAFRDTYAGDFPAGCITHVGLYYDSDLMIDRSTAGEPVRRQTLDSWWKERFVVGLRLYSLVSKPV